MTAPLIVTATKFVGAIVGDHVHANAQMCIWRRPDRRSKHFDSIERATAYIEQLESTGRYDIYFGCALYRPGIKNGRGKAADVVKITVLWADIDFGPGHEKNVPPDEAAARRILDRIPFPPSIVVNSGHGLHAYWLLVEPVSPEDGAAELARGFCDAIREIARLHGYELDAVGDLARVLRPPGTTNRKNPDDPRRVEVLEFHPERRYEADDLRAWIDDGAGEPVAASMVKSTQDNGDSELVLRPDAKPPEGFDDLLDNYPKLRNRWKGDTSGLKDTTPSGQDLAVTSLLVHHTKYTKQQIANCLIAFRRKHGNFGDRDKSLRPDYMRRTIAKAREGAALHRAEELVEQVEQLQDSALVWDDIDAFAQLSKAELAKVRSRLKEALGRQLNLNDFNAAVREARATAANAGQRLRRGNRPVILTARQECEIIDECINVLHRSNDPPRLFVQNADPIRIDSDENDRPIIRRADTAMVGREVHRFADVVRHRGEDKQEMPDRLTVETMRRLLASGSFPFPALEAVVESPVLRPDGSIIEAPGYDASTRLYYAKPPNLDVPAIPAKPSREDATRAAALIEDIIGQFPFASPADRANAYGLLLTPIVRQHIRGLAPMALLDSPTRGSGKSLLAKVVAVVATSTLASMTDCPTSDEEMSKKIAAALYTGCTVLTFDNVETIIDHASLGQVLTSEEYEQRLLGRNDVTLRLKNRCTWIATGNNLIVGGDMDRRCYAIRVDAKCLRPWQRPNSDFRHPFLLEHVRQHRGEILAALLTMCRAWIVAGRPKSKNGVLTLGGYERWAETVGGVLSLAGVHGFLGNLERLYSSMNVEDDDWTALIGHLWDVAYAMEDMDERQTKPFTVGTLARGLKNQFDAQKHSATALDHIPANLALALEKHYDSFANTLKWALRKREGVRYGTRQLHFRKLDEKDPQKSRDLWVIRRGD